MADKKGPLDRITIAEVPARYRVRAIKGGKVVGEQWVKFPDRLGETADELRKAHAMPEAPEIKHEFGLDT